LRYLWIGSLCIVQGDAEGWGLEPGKMTDVYAGASIALAATYSPDGTMGFVTRKPRDNLAPFFTGFNKDNSTYSIYCHSDWTHYYVDGQRQFYQLCDDETCEERQTDSH
jgi:hypothetical protein